MNNSTLGTEAIPAPFLAAEVVVAVEEAEALEPVPVEVALEAVPETVVVLPVIVPVMVPAPAEPAADKAEEQAEAVEPVTKEAEPLKSQASLLEPWDLEENWNGEVGKLGGSVSVTGLLVGGSTTPFVHVDTVEVGSFFFVTTGEVVGHGDSGVLVIVGGVTDRDGSVALLLDDVGVGLELVDDGLVTLEQFNGPGWVVSVDGEVWLRQIGNDVDTGFLQLGHTVRVVKRSVQGVHSDGVGVDFSQVWDVSLTGSRVG
ncbi:hypothetical protein WICPIJ_000939 [Wickerhamomyces pijperi]|uniref:Uncharacterized protein n=1 Tax=Wickerhamomyces pijperi TaxID=599730 RepID=A0A9P8QBP9_WICPI|nr:hypothetical protein WICPIJ_000939 [Wickerhamomyces pijperi]